MNSTELKLQLQELIANSTALKSLPQEARDMRANAMLNADEDTMKQFVAVLENESAQLQKIDDDMASQTDEINSLIAEAKQLEKDAQREIRKDAEVSERTDSETKAEDLLKKLDEISDK